MTDAETARKIAGKWEGYLGGYTTSLREDIADALTAARADERAKVVAWLKAQGAHAHASAIERGDHTPPAGGTNGK